MKSLRYIGIVILSLFLINSAFSTIYFKDDFDRADQNDIGWDYDSGSAFIIENGKLVYRTTGAGSVQVGQNFSAGNLFNISFEVTYIGASTDMLSHIVTQKNTGAYNPSGQRAAYVNNAGGTTRELRAFSGTWSDFYEYTDGDTFTLTMEHDETAEEINYYVDGNLELTKAYRESPNTDIEYIYLEASTTGGSTAYNITWDNFCIYGSGTSYSECFNESGGPTGAPVITLVNPVNNAYYNSNQTLNVSTDIDSHISYVLNGGSEITACASCNFSDNVTLSLTEGTNDLIVFANITSFESNETISFTLDLTNPTITNNIPSTSDSYLFNGSWFSCSDTNLDSCYITIDSIQNNTGNDFPLIHNGNLSYTITAIDLAGNNLTESGTIYVNPDQYFRFYDTLRSVYVEDYSFGSYNSVGEYVSIPLFDLGYGNHSLKFTKEGYENKTVNFEFTDTSQLNFTSNITAVTILIKMFDQDTNDQLTFDVTISNGTDFQTYENQINLSIYYNDSLKGDLEFAVTVTGYSDATFYNTIKEDTSISIIGFLFETNATELVLFEIKDKTSNAALEGVLVEIQQEVNDSYVTLSQKTTTATGIAYFYLDIDNEYNVLFSREGYVSTTATTIPSITSYTVKLEQLGTTYSYLEQLSYSLTPAQILLFENKSYSFGGFLSTTGITQLNYDLSLDNGTTLYTFTSSNPTGTSFQYDYFIPENINVTYIYANLTYIKDGDSKTILKTFEILSFTNTSIMKVVQDYGDDNSEEALIVKFLIICTLFVAILVGGVMIGIQTVNLGVIGLVVGLSVFGWMDWILAAVVIFISLVYFVGGRK